MDKSAPEPLQNAVLTTKLQGLLRAFGSHRYRFSNEAQLQDGLQKVLDLHGYHAQREWTLEGDENARFLGGESERPDFFVDGVAIEVKIKGGLTETIRQIMRYALHSQVKAILVIGTPSFLHRLPSTLNEKPVVSFRLMSSVF